MVVIFEENVSFDHYFATYPRAANLTGETPFVADLADFWNIAETGQLPAVSYLKAAAADDGRPGVSSPSDEQKFLIETINRIQSLLTWGSTVVFVTYDDSDGWYDHVYGGIVRASDMAGVDAACGQPAPGTYQGRCGYGPRVPLIAISPFARANFVGSDTAETASILRFIEDTWALGRIGDQSADATAGSLLSLFTFAPGETNSPLLLNALGALDTAGATGAASRS